MLTSLPLSSDRAHCCREHRVRIFEFAQCRHRLQRIAPRVHPSVQDRLTRLFAYASGCPFLLLDFLRVPVRFFCFRVRPRLMRRSATRCENATFRRWSMQTGSEIVHVSTTYSDLQCVGSRTLCRCVGSNSDRAIAVR